MTTSVPSWARNVPGYSRMRSELPAPQWDEISQNQLDDLRAKLRESILQAVIMALKGFFLPGPPGAATDQLTDWASNLNNDFADIWDGLVNLFTGGSSTGNAWADVEDAVQQFFTDLFGEPSPQSQILPGVVPNLDLSKIVDDASDTLQDFFDALSAGFGQVATGVTGAVLAALQQDQTETLATVNADLAALKAAQGGATGGGIFGGDAFERTNTGGISDTGNEWTQTQITGGSEDGEYVLNGHQAVWGNASGANSDTTVRYIRAADADKATTSLYQKVTLITGTSIPSGAYNTWTKILCRYNATSDSYVAVRLGRWSGVTTTSAQFGYKATGGSETWVGTAVPVTIGTGISWSVEAGDDVAGEPRYYRLRRNGEEVTYWDDSGDLSTAVAPGSTNPNVGWGFEGHGHWAGLFLEPPMHVGALTVADNLAPDYPGTGATMVRTGTGTVNASSGTNQFPSSFFGSNIESSANITPSLTDGSFTVRDAGRYTVSIGVKINTISSGDIHIVLFVDGSGYRVGSGAANRLGTINPYMQSTFANVTLAAGAVVSAGYYATNSTTGAFTGEGTGTNTYFTISRTG